MLSQGMLTVLGVQSFCHYRERIPHQSPLIVISNHRSFLDAPLLMAALNRSIHIACHHYMSQVPVLRELVSGLGCLPLEPQGQPSKRFFRQATQLLQNQKGIGIFPEGAKPMVEVSAPSEVYPFQRGFAHLALQAPVPNLGILPVAIAAHEERSGLSIPLPLLQFFDPSEPLFQQPGWQPAVIYRRVSLLIGEPLWITPEHRQRYQGKEAKAIVTEITQRCRDQITTLLHQGCYERSSL
nr:lysophospholipid acyltransferase family protein [Petrachloros mirabilis]